MPMYAFCKLSSSMPCFFYINRTFLAFHFDLHMQMDNFNYVSVSSKYLFMNKVPLLLIPPVILLYT